jgi:outer membrane lipoprotein carrier protein
MRIKDQGSRIKDQGSRIKDQGSRIKDQGSRIKDQGSRIKDQGSRIKDQGSRIKDQGKPLYRYCLHPESRALNPIYKDMMKYILAVLMLFVIPASAHAGAIEKLKTFIAATHSAQANFTQEVLDQNGKRIQSASGIMQFQRPGKFRWTYQKPYEQLIVGDGTRFWLYDVDLNQVTVRKLDKALGSSPAALLSGSNEIERGFSLTENGNRDGMEWLQAAPLGQDSSFNQILMAFNAQSELVVMELNDMFGHKTVLRFSAMQRNPKLSEKQFHFTPPKGADVVSE